MFQPGKPSNWIKDMWEEALTSDGVIARNDSVVKTSDVAKAYRAQVRKAYADSFAEVVGRSPRMDDQIAVFSRLLATQTLNEIEKHEYPEMKWVNGGLIAISSKVDEGADHFMWLEQVIIDEGDKLLANDSDDFPLVDISRAENFGRVHTFGRSFYYTTQEVRKSRFEGVGDIAADKGVATREAMDRNLENLIALGEPTADVHGIFRGPKIPNVRLLVGAWTGVVAPFTSIHDEMRALFNRINVNSNGVEEPDTVLFPHDVFIFLATNRNSDSSDITILDFLKKSYPSIKKWDWTRQNATGGVAVDGTDAPCILMYKNNASRIRVEVPMPPTPSEVEKRGRRFVTDMEARYGSLVIKRPESLLRGDGV